MSDFKLFKHFCSFSSVNIFDADAFTPLSPRLVQSCRDLEQSSGVSYTCRQFPRREP